MNAWLLCVMLDWRSATPPTCTVVISATCTQSTQAATRKAEDWARRSGLPLNTYFVTCTSKERAPTQEISHG